MLKYVSILLIGLSFMYQVINSDRNKGFFGGNVYFIVKSSFCGNMRKSKISAKPCLQYRLTIAAYYLHF